MNFDSVPFRLIPTPADDIDAGFRVPISYSGLSLFRNCRRAFYWHYLRGLRPLCAEAESQTLGSAIHRALEGHLRDEDDASIREAVAAHFPDAENNEAQHRNLAIAQAAWRAYQRRYPTEDFMPIGIEEEFTSNIINPETGARSRTFMLGGRIDAVVRRADCSLWLMEHKTASNVDDAYVSKLYLDLQIHLYAAALGVKYGEPITGCIYDVIGKPKIKQSTGETEEEFAARREEAIAKSKNGKTSIKRRIAETDDEFAARLDAWYDEPDRLMRIEMIFDQAQVEEIKCETWELTQQILAARRKDGSISRWYCNSDACFRFNRPCDYLPLCRSRGNLVVMQNQFKVDKMLFPAGE